ncbi:hypothetical protein KO481_05225 [Nocardia sp. NEAU-G5]|uniref:Ig-like domain-containing protein n=1 Tax=Nocardia albiluteola TaxID=2842303 RepID=A0ABS6ASB9_9NOCA|nr:hypothetical protein [Nocardia albiluteola]MBU3060924.1 hypothetical protein [Nocardia albiluteola]
MAPAGPPAPSGSSNSLSAWIAEGGPTDATPYGFATSRCTGTKVLPGLHAFTSPSTNLSCFAELTVSPGKPSVPYLTCQTRLTSTSDTSSTPYVYYTGNEVDTQVGHHGYPSDFQKFGQGPVLEYRHQIEVAGLRCRMDPTGLYCVDSKLHSGIRFSDNRIGGYSCLRPDAEDTTGKVTWWMC